MKTKFFLLLLVLIGIIIYVVPSYRNNVIQLLSYSQCDTPLAYRLGPIDEKFGLTNSQVLTDIQTAINVWNTAEGKQLFAYSPGAKLAVTFVYDQRAALSNQINTLQSQLSQKNLTLQRQVDAYNQQVQAFQEKLTAFDGEVAKYNSEGGAPPDVYAKLIKEQNDLNIQGDNLNATAKQLNLSTNNYNYNASILNGDISQFQNDLAQKPEEGLYNSTSDTITVYFANNQNELLHTLAHEFGHSLGMVHVKNPNGIMYAYASQSLQVTPEDMAQLMYVCREQSAIVHYLQVFDVWIVTIMQNIR